MSIQYELQKVINEGALIDGEGNERKQNITIITGIVGDPYGFIRTDAYTAVGSQKMTIEEFQDDIILQAQQFVLDKYPDV